MSIISFFDHAPEYNGHKVQIRGSDGYFDATAMGEAMGKRFNNWSRTKFAQEIIAETSALSGIPVDYSDLSSQNQTPLIDYRRGGRDGIWLHPYLAMAYAMSDPKFQARINIWVIELMRTGTINAHVLKWTPEEFMRGIQFNRDDIRDMYGQ